MKISEKLSPRKKWALGPPLLVQQGGANWKSPEWKYLILREIVPGKKKRAVGLPMHCMCLVWVYWWCIMIVLVELNENLGKIVTRKKRVVGLPMHCMCLVWVYWGYWEAVLSLGTHIVTFLHRDTNQYNIKQIVISRNTKQIEQKYTSQKWTHKCLHRYNLIL